MPSLITTTLHDTVLRINSFRGSGSGSSTLAPTSAWDPGFGIEPGSGIEPGFGIETGSGSGIEVGIRDPGFRIRDREAGIRDREGWIEDSWSVNCEN